MRDACDQLEYPIPETFGEREILKFAQGDKFNIPKASTNLVEHLKWQASLPPRIEITPIMLKLIHSGAFYLFGRDKHYRPCIIQDAGKIAELTKTDPDIVSNDNFINVFCFYFEYIKNVMFLPGQVETWVHICDLSNLGMMALPRQQLTALGKFM